MELLNKKCIAIIGSRNCSEYGKTMAKKITEELVQNDVVIVSGMAVGIDTVAHKSCLENGGKTIAVLGSGFKNIFPKENTELFYEIVRQGGLVLSEYALDEPVKKQNFPKRNRIISAISDGVLVVEASYRSGTSITAKYAKLQNKKVFCIPNSIGNKNSYGIIELMKGGACIVSSGMDILRNMGYEIVDASFKKNRDNKVSQLGGYAMSIFLALKEHGELNCDEIAYITNLNIVKVNQMLTYMELEGIVVNTNFNKYKLEAVYYE